MTPTVDTSPLSDAEILHLLRTLAPGVPPGLDQPPLPPASLTSPPWMVGPRARSPLRALALAAGSLGLLILWGLMHGGGNHLPVAASAAFATPAPGAVYWARAAATATPLPPLVAVLPAWTPAPTALAPTAVPTAVPPTVIPPTLLPPVATAAIPTSPFRDQPSAGPPRPTPVPRRAVVPAPPAPPPPTATAVPLPALPPPTDTPARPPALPVTPPTAGGGGAWGNDWSGSIFDRSATIGAPTPHGGTSP